MVTMAILGRVVYEIGPARLGWSLENENLYVAHVVITWKKRELRNVLDKCNLYILYDILKCYIPNICKCMRINPACPLYMINNVFISFFQFVERKFRQEMALGKWTLLTFNCWNCVNITRLKFPRAFTSKITQSIRTSIIRFRTRLIYVN